MGNHPAGRARNGGVLGVLLITDWRERRPRHDYPHCRMAGSTETLRIGPAKIEREPTGSHVPTRAAHLKELPATTPF